MIGAVGLGRLPADTTSFVGREHDVAEVKRLLAKARLVTLTGVGGVGKTRLALKAAANVRRAFADGVFWVELAQVQDPALVPHVVCDALGVHDDTGRSPVIALIEHLQDRQLLMVLDNCEHVVDVCAELVDLLLKAAPGLRVLATSRELLGIASEHVWPVSPLELPDPEQPLAPGAGLRYPALALFTERAVATEPRFAMTQDNQRQIVEVCQLLDGIPLAIELAAVRLGTVPLGEMLERLSEWNWSSVGARRAGLPQHQSLQAAVGWSYNLCTAGERILWARASVFAGGFDLAAAEFVCSGDELPAAEVLDLVARLVAKSVVTRVHDTGQVRFRLVEALRQYGRDRLSERGEEAEVRRRHRDYYAGLAELGEQEWFGAQQAEVFTRMRREQANLYAALDFCLTSSAERRAGLHLAGTLWFYWAGCGVLGEGRLWLDRFLTIEHRPGPERAKAMWVNGYLATLRGEPAAATQTLLECRRYALEVGDEVALAYSIHRLGCNQLIGDDLAIAKSSFADALDRYSRLGELNSNVMLAWIEQAIAELFLGDLDDAEQLCLRARRIGDESGERWAYAYAIWTLAVIAIRRGEVSEADSLARECLKIKRTFNDLLGMALAVEVLAAVAMSRRAFERGAVLLGAANRIWRSVGSAMFGSAHFGALRAESEAAARQALGEHAFEAAIRHGSGLEISEGAAYALEETETVAPPAPEAAPAVLTARERQVAELIADGLSNKAIAQKLVVAPRTAEGHVERILQKLGFSSRTQVAVWLLEHRRVESQANP